MTTPPAESPTNRYLSSALAILREAAGEIDRLSPKNTAADALTLIVNTTVRLVDAQPGDRPAAIAYAYDPGRATFDAASRAAAGEGEGAGTEDFPRPDGMGAFAIRQQRRVLSYEEPAAILHPAARRAGIHARVCYPLLIGGEPAGAVYLGLHSDRRFRDEELGVLDLFLTQAASALHNTQRFKGINRTLQRKVDELERLRSAERLISSRRSLGETMREILRTAIDLTCAAHGSFRLYDKRKNVLRLAALSEIDGPPPNGADDGLPVDDTYSIVGWVAKHRQPARVDDLTLPPWSAIYRPLHSSGRMLSELAMPLLGAGGGLEGVLNLESPTLAGFSEDDQRLMEALATQTVIALQEAKLLEALEEISDRMIHQPLDQLLAYIIDRACDLINAPQGAVWVLSSTPADTLVVRAATAGHSPGETLPLRGSLIGICLQDRRPLTSPDVSEDPRFLRRELAKRMGWVSALIVPLLMRDGTPRGALTLYASEAREYSEGDKRLLTWLANHTAIAVQEADTLRELAQARERQTMAETFAALGDVAANLLHRVNNLVGIIPVRIQGVVEKRPALRDDAYVNGALTEIEESARAAMAAAREAMAYLRPVKVQPVSVAACFATALGRIDLPAKVAVTADGLEDLPPVEAGEEQLRLVFFNLVENALDALLGMPQAPEGGARIRVRGAMTAEAIGARQQVEISIADNGPGVPPDKRESIFDLSFSTKRSPRKLGFGLWWVKTLVNRFGGEVRAAEAEGGGTAIIVRLPVAEIPRSEPA